MIRYRLGFLLVCCAGLAYFPWLCFGAPEDMHREKLLRFQSSVRQLALAYDVVVVEGLQFYPKPDWEFRLVGGQQDYYRYWPVSEGNQALSVRIGNERRSSHFDIVGLYPGHSDQLTTETVRAVHQFELQRDPFATSCFLGYISTFQDYWLISQGPDGVSDILGFHQYLDGSYAAEGGWMKLTPEELGSYGRAARAKFTPTAYETFDVTTIRDVSLLYDPTNGALSRGDIVFHRRSGDDWLFSFAGPMPVTPQNLIPKELAPARATESLREK